MTSEWSQKKLTRLLRSLGPGCVTNLQNDFQSFCGYEPRGNALFERSAHSDGSEVIKIDVPDKASRSTVIDRGYCGMRSDGKKRSISINKRSQGLQLMATYRRFQTLQAT